MTKHERLNYFISASELAKRTGKTTRYWQRMAAEGKIGFASRPGGKGTQYYFDVAAFEAWMANGARKKSLWEKSPGSRTYGGGGRLRGVAWNGEAKPTGSPLKQRIQKLLGSASKSGSKASRPRSGAKSQSAPTMKRLTAS